MYGYAAFEKEKRLHHDHDEDSQGLQLEGTKNVYKVCLSTKEVQLNDFDMDSFLNTCVCMIKFRIIFRWW
jgi:hypothetical protein